MLKPFSYANLFSSLNYSNRIFLIAFIGLFFNMSKALPAEQQKADLEDSSLQLYKICVSDKHKIVYFRNQKCGNGTICYLLEKYAQAHTNQKAYPFDSENYTNYYKFSIVRNPWDRAVSCYCHKIKRNKNKETFQECFGRDFEYFVHFLDRQYLSRTNRHIRLQSKLIPMKQVDYIGRYENLEDELKYLFASIGVEDLEISHKHGCPREHDHYSLYYTDETRDIIARKYKKDIEIFGYQFEDLR